MSAGRSKRLSHRLKFPSTIHRIVLANLIVTIAVQPQLIHEIIIWLYPAHSFYPIQSVPDTGLILLHKKSGQDCGRPGLSSMAMDQDLATGVDSRFDKGIASIKVLQDILICRIEDWYREACIQLLLR